MEFVSLKCEFVMFALHNVSCVSTSPFVGLPPFSLFMGADIFKLGLSIAITPLEFANKWGACNAARLIHSGIKRAVLDDACVPQRISCYDNCEKHYKYILNKKFNGQPEFLTHSMDLQLWAEGWLLFALCMAVICTRVFKIEFTDT